MNPTVVLLAAGMSTRYGRLKQLEPVGPDGEALLDYAVFDARRVGISRVLLVIREELEEIFRVHVEERWPKDLDVVFHHQKLEDLPGLGLALPASPHLPALLKAREKPWGTAHALLSARDHLSGPFILLNADDFYGESAYQQAAEFFRGLEPYRDMEMATPPPTMGDDHSWQAGGGPGVGVTTDGMDGGGASVRIENPPTFGLVTYTLSDTLSRHGGVSRGICQVDPMGWLEGVREVLEIRQGVSPPGGLFGRTVPGQAVSLNGGEPISTNFWLFTPTIFPLLKEGFVAFLRALGESSSKPPEFLIPSVVNSALEAGVATVKALPTRGRFLGITHPEDREWVVNGLEEMTRAGEYPRPLWE